MSDSVPIAEVPAAAQPDATVEPPRSEPTGEKKPGVGVTIAKNSFWLMLDTVVGMLATLYSSILVARRLGPDFMGNYNYILWFATVLRMVTEVAIPATVRKFAAEFMGRGDYVTLKSMLQRAMRLQAKLAIAGVSLGLVFVTVSFAHEQRIFATLAVLSVLPGLFLSIPAGALWATENLRHNVMASLAATSVNLVGLTASVFFGWGLIGLMASLLTSRVVDCILRFTIFRRQYDLLPGQARKGPLEEGLRKRMIPFAAQQMLLSAFYTLLFDRMEVFFLRSMAPSREIAFFSVPFTLVFYLLQFPQQMSGAAGASMMVKQGRSPAEAARIAATATWFMMLVAAPVLFGVASVSDPLLRVMYGAKYLPAIPVLATLAMFALSLGVSQPAQYLLVAAEKQNFYLLWLAVSGVVDVVANLLLVPRFGALGAAYGKGASQLVAAAGFLTFMVVHFRVTLPVARMIKLMVAVTAMFLSVRALLRFTESALPGLALGVPFGVLVFVLAMRLLRCLDVADADRLRQIGRLLPGPARRSYGAIVAFLVPA
jgi:O-antigen/teichoic acid export membrane protein